MAEQLLIGPSRASVKLRSPWAVALLPFITLGVYHLVWWYRINRELRDVGHANGVDLGQSPASSLLALFPGALIIVPPFVSYWRGTNRVNGAARLAGTEPVNGWIALVLFIVIQPAYWAYLQSSLNKAWGAAAREPADTPVQGAPPPPAMAPAAARDELAPTADRDGTAPAGERAPAPSAANAGDADPNSTASPRERDPSLDAPVPADPDAPAHEPGGESATRPD
jgi:Domain of unknown function (DUF4234)